MNIDLIIILTLSVIIFLISLVVERLIEVFDWLIILNLFPWWRSAPRPPLIKLPSRSSAEQGRDDNSDYPLANANAMQATSNDGEDDFGEAEFNDETEFVKPLIAYRRRLIYYIIKYGYFLSEKGLWQRLVNWVLGARNVYPYSLLEVWLAHREGVSLLPGAKEDENFVKRLVNDEEFAKRLLGPLPLPQRKGSAEPDPEIVLITQLQFWADYCYLRNQRTYQAFTRLKGQVYLFLGSVGGILLVNLFTSTITPENLLAWASSESSTLIVQQPGQPPNNWVRWILGGGSGSLSPVTHGFTRRIANAGLRNFRRI